MGKPDARARAEAELVSNPRRSDYVIAELTGCPLSTVNTRRHQLEASGMIPVVPVGDRRWRNKGDIDDNDTVNVVDDGGPHRGRYKVSDSTLPAGFYRPVDEIEQWCCTQEWAGGNWVHGRSCPFRRSAVR